MDIDSDFQDTKREEIIKYVVNKYGADKVARIRTLGKMKARLAIRDTGAVFEIDTILVDKVAKLIPEEPKMTLDKALKASIELKELYDTNKDVKFLIDTSKTIEGAVRQMGSHAAGLIISDAPLTDYGALIKDGESEIPIFCYDMAAVEYLKLIKFDFLGLKTLSVEADTLEFIKKDEGIEIDLDNIPLDDKKVWNYISSGQTEGVFQLESAGMQDFMKKLKPTCFEDLILGVSVYRPGPMDSIPDIIKGKEDPKSVSYPKDAEKILGNVLDVTYGNLVYQEQVMALVRDMAGYSFGRSDLIRRAMSKKKSDVMDYERFIFTYGEVVCPDCGGTGTVHGEKCIRCNGKGRAPAKNICPFCRQNDENCPHCKGTGFLETEGEYTVKGCVNNGISEKTATEIYDKMIIFSAYAFNKSHATAYAKIGYETAYLKYYYPRQYMTAYLNSLTDASEIKKFVQICKDMGITIHAPSIQKSSSKFTEDSTGIYMGLTCVKSVGDSIQDMIDCCEGKKIDTLEDFLEAYAPQKGDFEKLAKVGVFDKFGYTRATLVNNAERIAKAAKKHKERVESGQISLFDIDGDDKINLELVNESEYSYKNMLSSEKELTGFYLSGHPLDLPEYASAVKKSNIKSTAAAVGGLKNVTLTGIISFDEKREGVKYSKSGKKYAIFDLEDAYGTIKTLAFDNCFTDFGYENIQNGKIVTVSGKIDVQKDVRTDENGEKYEVITSKIIAYGISVVEETISENKLFVKIKKNEMALIDSIIRKYPGTEKVIYFYKEDSSLVPSPSCIRICDASIKEIAQIATEKGIFIDKFNRVKNGAA